MDLKINAINSPKNIAADIPPAAPAIPPVNTPINPSVSTAFFTPSNRTLPNPVSGTVAPAPANSTSGLYSPTAERITPDTT